MLAAIVINAQHWHARKGWQLRTPNVLLKLAGGPLQALEVGRVVIRVRQHAVLSLAWGRRKDQAPGRVATTITNAGVSHNNSKGCNNSEG